MRPGGQIWGVGIQTAAEKQEALESFPFLQKQTYSLLVHCYGADFWGKTAAWTPASDSGLSWNLTEL